MLDSTSGSVHRLRDKHVTSTSASPTFTPVMVKSDESGMGSFFKHLFGHDDPPRQYLVAPNQAQAEGLQYDGKPVQMAENGLLKSQKVVPSKAPASQKAAVFTTQTQLNGYENGFVTITDNHGKVHTFAANSGGATWKKNGKIADHLPAGVYTITDPQPKDTDEAGMVQNGVGYKFHLNDAQGRHRLRVHPNDGTGTHGCLGIVGDAQTQTEFRDLMRAQIHLHHGHYTVVVQ